MESVEGRNWTAVCRKLREAQRGYRKGTDDYARIGSARLRVGLVAAGADSLTLRPSPLGLVHPLAHLGRLTGDFCGLGLLPGRPARACSPGPSPYGVHERRPDPLSAPLRAEREVLNPHRRPAPGRVR